ncbi:SLC13 family permease [Desulfococcus sp.]|uniref:SLC13 family permease n=1 Tax=Desulfococcus sp. TaxID=2025834 RepID=UPI0035940210
MTEAALYFWSRLPLLLMFLNGYLIYRLLVVTGLTEQFVAAALGRSAGDPRRLFLYIILSAALLSFFIPNAVTVLTLLPVLKDIHKRFHPKLRGRIITPLTLSVIYGANIGGMGSIVGSPANLLFIGAMDLYEVPGRQAVGFFNWFLWSIPLVSMLTALAWGVVVMGCGSFDGHAVKTSRGIGGASGRRRWRGLYGARRSGALLFLCFTVFWTLEAAIRGIWPSFAAWSPLACLVYFTAFCRLVFWGMPLSGDAPLMRPKALVQDFPGRGILLLIPVAALVLVAGYFDLDARLSALYQSLLPAGASPFTVMLSTVVTVILLTEVLSNTLVSTAFFPIAYHTAVSAGFSPIALMIAVSTASTCAFMTPIATPCNAFAFGEMKGTSLARMMALGLILNTGSALCIAVWLNWVIPYVYG